MSGKRFVTLTLAAALLLALLPASAQVTSAIGDKTKANAGHGYVMGPGEGPRQAGRGLDGLGGVAVAAGPGIMPETVSAGADHTCGLKTDGTVVCWGNNGAGQSTPPAHAAGDFAQVSAGWYHTCGLTGAGTVSCWGANGNGQSTPPAHFAGDFAQVSAGWYHTCGLKTDGSVTCWGRNDYGQTGPPAHSAGDFARVSAGGFHTCRLTGAGSVVCWGRDDDGQSSPSQGGVYLPLILKNR